MGRQFNGGKCRPQRSSRHRSSNVARQFTAPWEVVRPAADHWRLLANVAAPRESWYARTQLLHTSSVLSKDTQTRARQEVVEHPFLKYMSSFLGTRRVRCPASTPGAPKFGGGGELEDGPAVSGAAVCWARLVKRSPACSDLGACSVVLLNAENELRIWETYASTVAQVACKLQAPTTSPWPTLHTVLHEVAASGPCALYWTFLSPSTNPPLHTTAAQTCGSLMYVHRHAPTVQTTLIKRP